MIVSRCVFILIATAISSLIGSANARSLSHSAEREFLQIVRDVNAEQQNTGLVFIMAHNGKVILEDHMGMAVIENDVPIEYDSRFPIMSVTKAFTGAALATALDKGLVDLDTPVNAYLPDYPGEGAEEITLRMLATHMSGIPHTGHPDRKHLYVEHYESAGESIGAYSERPLLAAPGEKYAYSSSGYNLIAAIIEKTSGMNYAEYVRQNVIEPLGLASTDFDDVTAPIRNKVRNYSFVDIWDYSPSESLQEVPTWDFSYNLGGGDMYSTASDLLKYGQAIASGTVFSESAIKLMTTPAASDPDRSPWSLGWIISKDPHDRRIIYITGATPGVQAALYVYPDENLVFVALANCWGKGSGTADLVIGAPQRLVDRYLNDLEN